MRTKTRKEIAAGLWARLQRGPTFGPLWAREELSAAEIERRVRGWLNSWIVDDVARLVPELRDKLDGPRLDCLVRDEERPR